MHRHFGLTHKNKKSQLLKADSIVYPRGESNPNRRNRNPIFYPLNYGDELFNSCAKLVIIFCQCKTFLVLNPVAPIIAVRFKESGRWCVWIVLYYCLEVAEYIMSLGTGFVACQHCKGFIGFFFEKSIAAFGIIKRVEKVETIEIVFPIVKCMNE